jgi:hypothetical protein
MFFVLFSDVVVHVFLFYLVMAGRPRALREIVSEILPMNAIIEEKWDIFSLVYEIQDLDRCIAWLAKRQLIANSKICANCQIPCTFQSHKHSIDGKRWHCSQCNRFSVTIRAGSFFSKSHLNLKNLIMLMYWWSQQHSNKSAAREFHVGKKSVIDWFNFMRDICTDYVNSHTHKIGGYDEDINPLIVELDETVIRKRKYHRGRVIPTNTQWLFGGIERISGECFLELVPNRRADTLLPIIEKYVNYGTYIMTDGHASYNTVSQIGNGIYSHSVVVHENNFVSPFDVIVHTQNVECLWSRLKRKFKCMHGTYSTLLASYIHEFLWRINFVKSRDAFSCIIIAEKYKV